MMDELVINEIAAMFDDFGEVPPRDAAERTLAFMVSRLQTSFWTQFNEMEQEERMRLEPLPYRVDDRDVLIEQGVIDADLYAKRWLVCRAGSDDVIMMFDDYRDADNFRMAMIDAETETAEGLEAGAEMYDRLVRGE